MTATGKPRGRRLRLDPYAMVRMTTRQHAKRLGVSERTLQYRFRAYGANDQRTWSRENNRHVLVRDPEGVQRTITAHAKHYGLEEGTLRTRGQRYGWDDQRTWYRGRISTGGYGGGAFPGRATPNPDAHRRPGEPIPRVGKKQQRGTNPPARRKKLTKAQDRELAAAELAALAESAGFGRAFFRGD